MYGPAGQLLRYVLLANCKHWINCSTPLKLDTFKIFQGISRDVEHKVIMSLIMFNKLYNAHNEDKT